MRQYEIHILRDDSMSARIVVLLRVSDNVAIRSARNYAGDRNFEVWRGSDCIYEVARFTISPTSNSPTAVPEPSSSARNGKGRATFTAYDPQAHQSASVSFRLLNFLRLLRTSAGT